MLPLHQSAFEGPGGIEPPPESLENFCTNRYAKVPLYVRVVRIELTMGCVPAAA